MTYTTEETLNLRIQHKTDISTNWNAVESTFTPLKGELIFYSDLNSAKIGDGKTKLKDLPFIAQPPMTAITTAEVHKTFNDTPAST